MASRLVYIGSQGGRRTYYDRAADKILTRTGNFWMCYYERSLKEEFVEPVTIPNNQLDIALNTLHTPIYSPAEIGGLTIFCQDILSIIEYYLRAVYPVLCKITPQPLFTLFNDFNDLDVTGMVDYNDPGDLAQICFRGVYYRGKEIRIWFSFVVGRPTFQYGYMEKATRYYINSHVYEAIITEKLNTMKWL